MTDTAKELREALDAYDSTSGEAVRFVNENIIDAARTIALPILEADPELVERMAKVMQRIRTGIDLATAPAEFDHANARAVLAAISTPTPVGGKEIQ